jgi:hypothetical protein
LHAPFPLLHLIQGSPPNQASQEWNGGFQHPVLIHFVNDVNIVTRLFHPYRMSRVSRAF